MFVRNCWYVIAWDQEISTDGLFARRVLNEPIVMYRTAAGDVVALKDQCCHRLAPLSQGRKEGDCVRCGYHGLEFDAAGTCVEIPGHDKAPPKDGLLVAFHDDRDMITARSQAIDADPGASILLLGMDSALVQFRRLVDQALQSERAPLGRPIEVSS